MYPTHVTHACGNPKRNTKQTLVAIEIAKQKQVVSVVVEVEAIRRPGAQLNVCLNCLQQ